MLNQFKGHWLLSDALTKMITLTLNMEIKLLQLFSPFNFFDLFEIMILLLHTNVWFEIIKAIKLFLDFLRSFDAWHVHNMMVIMLDPHFKALHIVQSLVWHRNACNLTSIEIWCQGCDSPCDGEFWIVDICTPLHLLQQLMMQDWRLKMTCLEWRPQLKNLLKH